MPDELELVAEPARDLDELGVGRLLDPRPAALRLRDRPPRSGAGYRGGGQEQARVQEREEPLLAGRDCASSSSRSGARRVVDRRQDPGPAELAGAVVRRVGEQVLERGRELLDERLRAGEEGVSPNSSRSSRGAAR